MNVDDDLVRINICGAVPSRSTLYTSATHVLKNNKRLEDLHIPLSSGLSHTTVSWSEDTTDITTVIDRKVHRLRFTDIKSHALKCVKQDSSVSKIHAFLIVFDSCSVESLENALTIYNMCYEYCEAQHVHTPAHQLCSTVIALIENLCVEHKSVCVEYLAENKFRWQSAVYKCGDLNSHTDTLRIITDVLEIVGKQVHARRQAKVDYDDSADSTHVIGIGRYSFPVRVISRSTDSATYMQEEYKDTVCSAMNEFG